jgi:putative ABC transport system permease protein
MIRAASDTLGAALATLGANKLRSVLTLLGIVIGVGTVVGMAATMEGMRRQVNQSMAQLGTGVFQVQKWPINGGPGSRMRADKRKNFTLADVHLLEDRCTECLRVAGEGWGPGQTVSAGERMTRPGTWVVGGTEHVFTNNGYAVASGRLFTPGECESGGEVIVLGSDVAEKLFPDQDPIGREVHMAGRGYRVVGTLERRGNTFGPSIDNIVALPLATFLVRFGARQSLNLTIQARDPGRIMRAQDEVVALLRRARGVAPEAENDFEVFSNDSVQQDFEQTASIITVASIGVTFISLLIAGIGVMNIMLVSVTERTSEIGVRRALGARRRRILGQFLVEAIILTSIGGLLGILFGERIAAMVTIFADVPTAIPAWAIVLAMLAAAGTGLLSGLYPAWRASQLDPVEAMRHE